MYYYDLVYVVLTLAINSSRPTCCGFTGCFFLTVPHHGLYGPCDSHNNSMQVCILNNLFGLILFFLHAKEVGLLSGHTGHSGSMAINSIHSTSSSI